MEQQIHSANGFQGNVPHSCLEQISRIQEPGEIVKDVLGVGLGPDPGDREASGLGLGADNRQMLAEERIEQAGLADVRSAGKGDVAGSDGHR
jgi:hypothetical protein